MHRHLLGLVGAAIVGGLLIPPASAHHPADLDCADFDSQASAQYHMNAHPGDPDGLDGDDDDGRACELNPAPYYYGTATGPVEPSPTPTPTPTPEPEPEPPLRQSARVISVIDGDTLRVRLASGATRSVRLLGIDTPESGQPGTPLECGARRATRAMKRLALRRVRGTLRGEKVRLRSDPTQDTTDVYGRTLAYVDRRRDGKDLGGAMIRSGWAMVYAYGDVPFRRVNSYTAAQQAATDRGAGVWGRCGGDFHRPA